VAINKERRDSSISILLLCTILTLLEVSRHICRPRVKSIPPTYMSPKIKGYTDIYVILTYTGSETDVSFGLFIPEIHFFGQGLKFYSPLKGLIYIIIIIIKKVKIIVTLSIKNTAGALYKSQIKAENRYCLWLRNSNVFRRRRNVQ